MSSRAKRDLVVSLGKCIKDQDINGAKTVAKQFGMACDGLYTIVLLIDASVLNHVRNYLNRDDRVGEDMERFARIRSAIRSDHYKSVLRCIMTVDDAVDTPSTPFFRYTFDVALRKVQTVSTVFDNLDDEFNVCPDNDLYDVCSEDARLLFGIIASMSRMVDAMYALIYPLTYYTCCEKLILPLWCSTIEFKRVLDAALMSCQSDATALTSATVSTVEAMSYVMNRIDSSFRQTFPKRAMPPPPVRSLAAV